MAAVSHIVFWQPIASPHQEAFLESVADQFDGEVVLAVERLLPAARVAQGWRGPRHEKVKVVDISRPDRHAALAALGGTEVMHVFSGFFSHRLVWSGFRKLAPTRARLVIYSEAPEQPPATGWIKRLRGRWLASQWAGRFAFVLAIGGIGCEFFEEIGFPTAKVLPFGYYLDVPPMGAATRRPDDEFVRLVSAGQLIPRKGVDLLVEACAGLSDAGWTLDVFGDGPERRRLERAVARFRLEDRIRFRGTIPNECLRAELASYDRAILPSRFDGWGTLANEALAAGTPVICTDCCGAVSIVAGGPGNRVVTAGRVDRLAAALADAVAQGPTPPDARAEIRRVAAAKSAAPLAAARFLAEVRRG